MYRALVPVLLVLTAPGALAEPTAPEALADSSVLVRRSGGMSPFQSIEYEIRVWARTPVATHTRTLVNYPEPLQKMALLTWEEYAAIWEVIDGASLDVSTGATSPPGLAAPTWHLELRRGTDRRVVTAAGIPSELPSDVRAIVTAVVSIVVEQAGSISFRNVFFEKAERGWLDVESVPPARVYLDGRDLGETTPLYTYEVEAGRHELRLVAEDRGLDRTWEVQVHPGMTTILNLDLR
jgi:hypothetical protein